MEQKNSIFTGFLRDGVKRIDLVLVINDDGDGKVEMFRVNFLNNGIKAGLEIELESGVKAKHKHLIFVKIHAPAHIIQEYGAYFNVRKYFKESHEEFINVRNKFQGMANERALIKAVRMHDPGPINYSSLERSIIVYRVLLSLPFGFHENYFGLNRLLENRIILDAYPLHDGPYFLVDDQDPTVVNGRQVLFHTWLSLFKMIKGQPFNLINEYLGGKVAFYFAFSDYYIKGLLVTAILSVLTTIVAMSLKDYLKVIDSTCRPRYTLHSEMCPACTNMHWCPIRPTRDYCFKAHLVHITHSAPTVLLCLFIGLWSIVLITLWTRRKNYLDWLWEINRDEAESSVRPQYNISGKILKKSNITGISTIFQNCGLVLYNAFFYFLHFFFVLVVTIAIMLHKHWLLSVAFGTKVYWCFYIVLILIAIFHLCFASAMENINKRLSFVLTDYENPKTHASYERRYVWKFFIFNMFAYLILFIYYILFSVYAYEFRPLTGENPTLFEKIRYMNCGPYGCADEICILLLVVVLLKEFLCKLPLRLLEVRTDYNRGKSVNSEIPCWEKEYELCPIDEDFLNDKYMSLVLQFALGTFFIQAFPLMPLLIFIINIWDISYTARFILTGCRRPLVLNTSGIGAWQQIIIAVGYAVPLLNILSIAWGSQVVERNIFCALQQERNPNPQSENYMRLYNTFFGYTTTAALLETCSFPIMLEKFIPLNRYWEAKRLKWWFIFFYEHFYILFALLLRWLLPPYAKDVKKTIIIERDIKHKYFVSKGINK